MANNPEGAETFHEVPASKYYYLGDFIGAVPKGFFKYWTASIIVFTATATFLALETNVWQRLFIWIFVTNWIISIPLTALICGVGWFMYDRRLKRIRRQKAEALHRRRFEEATIKQGGGGKKQ